jgi:hypothetical protein
MVAAARDRYANVRDAQPLAPILRDAADVHDAASRAIAAHFHVIAKPDIACKIGSA